MALEIERKFIVNKSDIPWDDQLNSIYISQGYFPFFKSCRVRKSRIDPALSKCEITFKKNTKDPLVRKEYNAKIPVWFFNICYTCTPFMKKVEKIRTKFPGGEEVNEYMSNKLFSMEKEFGSKEEGENYTPPFRVVLEITKLSWAKDPYLGCLSKEKIWDKIFEEMNYH
jgi:CYTH domain-containing protein